METIKITQLEDAKYKIKEYYKVIGKETNPITEETNMDGIQLKAHPNSKNPLWEISEKNIDFTLDYIFTLCIPCYLFIIHNKNIVVIHIVPPLNEVIIKKINKLKKKVFDNEDLNDEEKIYIEKNSIQSIFNSYLQENVTIDPYIELIRSINIENSVFLVNIFSDILISSKGTHPFDFLFKDFTIGNYYSFIPILSQHIKQESYDIPIPNCKEMGFIYDNIHYFDDIKEKWEEKTKDVLLYRGTLSNKGYNSAKNKEIELYKMSQQPEYKNIMDVKFTKNTHKLFFDETNGIGMLHSEIDMDISYDLSIQQKSDYKYLLYIEKDHETSILEYLKTGSLVFKVSNSKTSWYESYLIENEHYISIDEDFSNIDVVLDWCKSNQEKCKEISEKGKKIATILLQKNVIEEYFKKTLFPFPIVKTLSNKDNTIEVYINEDTLYIPVMITKKISIPLEHHGKNIEHYFLSYSQDKYENKCIEDGFVRKGSSSVVKYTPGILENNYCIYNVLFKFDMCVPYKNMKTSCIIQSFNKIGFICVVNEVNSPIYIYVTRELNQHINFDDYKLKDKIKVIITKYRFEYNDHYISCMGKIIR